RKRFIVELTVVGRDRKGAVASFTNAIFTLGGNIEIVNQNVVRGLFGMHLEASFTQDVDKSRLAKDVKLLGKEFGMEVGLHYKEEDRALNLAIMVTRERHCLQGILEAVRAGELKARVAVIIGSEPSLRGIAEE